MTTRWQAGNGRQSRTAGASAETHAHGNGKANAGAGDAIGIFRFASVPGVEVLAAADVVATGRPVLHNDLELRFIVHGAVQVAFNHQVQVARAGWLLQLPPGELHTLTPVDTNAHSFLALRLGINDLDRYGGTMGRVRTAPPALACEPAPAALAALVSSAFAELTGAQEPPVVRDATPRALSALMIGAAHAKTHAASSAATRLPAIERALDHLRERYLHEISLDDLAAAAGMSKFHFLRLFSVALGATPHRYQLLLRIAHARELLRDGAEIAAVAHSTGFFDQSHFSRCFREIVGITPGRYRIETAPRCPRNPVGTRGPNGPQARAEFQAAQF